MSERKPVRKVVSGRISVSFWEYEGKNGKYERACVQHSSKDWKTKNWVNQQIWLNTDELRDLANALDKLNSQPEVAEETVVEEVGEKSPSSSSSSSSCSKRVHSIIEYIKANSLEADLNVYDVDAMSVGDILGSFGIHTSLASWEGRLVRRELRDYVEKKEFSESAYMAQKCELLPLIPQRRRRFGRR